MAEKKPVGRPCNDEPSQKYHGMYIKTRLFKKTVKRFKEVKIEIERENPINIEKDKKDDN
jgi:hypothetical protein